MRKIQYSFIGLFMVLFITSAALKTYESKRLFEKIVFIEVSSNEDSILFKPFSKAWDENWDKSSEISVNGSSLMNYNKYKFSFKDRTENLWTILHPNIIDGTIKTYYPYDPETFGLGHSDKGKLRYPIIDQDKNETFLTSERLRENLCNLLGRFGPMPDYPFVNYYGGDSIKILDDGSIVNVYPYPDFYWHEDKDIVKYKLRVSILLNKKGIEKKRVIKSICPVVNQISETGEVIDEKEIIWLNFEEIEPILKEAYYFDEDWKPVSYLNYILRTVKNADIRDKG